MPCAASAVQAETGLPLTLQQMRTAGSGALELIRSTVLWYVRPGEWYGLGDDSFKWYAETCAPSGRRCKSYK